MRPGPRDGFIRGQRSQVQPAPVQRSPVQRPPGRGARDPFGIGGRQDARAPIVSAIGLLVIALLTGYLVYHPIPLPDRGGQANGGGVSHTAVPSNVVVPNPDVTVRGSLVYAKAGNLWIQTGTRAHQLTTSTSGSQASSPAWSPDGQWIYYIDTRITSGRWPPGSATDFELTYTVLSRIHPDGTGRQDILSGLFTRGDGRYFYWILQPSISPDGKTAAVISDGPNPDAQDTTLQFVNLASGKLLPEPKLPETAPLGHTDPVWSPDGKTIAYVMEGREGVHGAPSIWLYDVAAGTAHQLSATGYREPTWSPDGRYLAVTRATPTRTDVVILDASSGKQVATVTSDGSSWYPVWSPAGDTIVYMHVSGQVIDLESAHITEANGRFSFSIKPLTQDSGLDGPSRPAWYVPPSQLPASSGSPSPSGSGSPGAPAS